MFPKPRLKTGETLLLEVETLSAKAQGVATVGGRPILVRETLPGDQIQAQLTRVRPPHLEAKLLRVERASSQRIIPRCEHFGPCGGCDLQHLAYEHQVLWKTQTLSRTLKEEGGMNALPEIRVVSMEEPWAYRSKMEFSFGQEGGRVTLGLHQRGSFQRIVDIRACHIAPPNISELLAVIKEAANRFGLPSYDPKSHQGFWRYAVVRTSFDRGDLMLLLVTNEGPPEPLEALAEEIPRRVPSLKSFYWGISTKVSDVASPSRMVFLGGSEVLEDRVGEIRFQIRPTNFVQPNLGLTGPIYQAIAEEAQLTGREAVYDLYCGIGLIALSLARGAKAVYGVESDPENVSFAQRNAALNGIANAAFLCGKVEDLLKGRTLFKAGPRPDAIVVDPPRAGLHADVYAPLLDSQAPVLMYLSCNPLSLARDLKVLLQRDPAYRVGSVRLFDFFPHTTHMETLVTLRRAPP
ncbi:MAG: 23S rRNA (uracil(1939)-C(5))-methyltransferase RlmD [Candidatus Omnitrophica bacterium]|nr:23S rRNA (uracil(1939)-C(5))-methyltransferase RlmD [Candidatus Omnitrophota bacterium]